MATEPPQKPLTERERALILATWSDRLASDPLAHFELTPKQRPFVHAVLRGPTSENWFIAANRSGKSDAGAYCGATLARFGPEDPRPAVGPGATVRDRATSGWVAGVDANVNRDVIQPKYFDNGFAGRTTHEPFIPKREVAEWRPSDQILKLKNGSLIGWKAYEQGRLKFQGAGKDWIHFDEEPPKDIFDEAAIRVEAGRRLRIFGTCTLLPPEGHLGGVSWLFPEVIQPVEAGTRPGIGLFGASIYDNPHLEAAEIARLESIYPEGSAARRIRLGGEWLAGLSGARAYGNFARALHLRPQPWPPVPRRPLCWVWDFNVEPLVTLIGQRDFRVFRVLKELVLDEGNIGEMCDWFRAEVPSHFGELWVYGDATGKGRTGQTGVSDYLTVQNALRGYGSPLRLKVPAANPLVKDRVNAVNRILRDEAGEILLEVDPSCRELAADLEQVITDGRGGIRKTFNRRDPYVRRTHTSDALGYWISFEEPVRAFTAGGALRPPARVPAPAYAWGHGAEPAA